MTDQPSGEQQPAPTVKKPAEPWFWYKEKLIPDWIRALTPWIFGVLSIVSSLLYVGYNTYFPSQPETLSVSVESSQIHYPPGGFPKPDPKDEIPLFLFTFYNRITITNVAQKDLHNVIVYIPSSTFSKNIIAIQHTPNSDAKLLRDVTKAELGTLASADQVVVELWSPPLPDITSDRDPLKIGHSTGVVTVLSESDKKLKNNQAKVQLMEYVWFIFTMLLLIATFMKDLIPFLRDRFQPTPPLSA